MTVIRNIHNIQIEHGVPIPHSKRGTPATFPFRELTSVTDGFFVPEPDRKIRSMRSLCSWWGRAERWEDGKAREFRCEAMVKDGAAGIMVVRTA